MDYRYIRSIREANHDLSKDLAAIECWDFCQYSILVLWLTAVASVRHYILFNQLLFLQYDGGNDWAMLRCSFKSYCQTTFLPSYFPTGKSGNRNGEQHTPTGDFKHNCRQTERSPKVLLVSRLCTWPCRLTTLPPGYRHTQMQYHNTWFWIWLATTKSKKLQSTHECNL